MIEFSPTKSPAVKLPSIHPLLWMAREFIAKVPVEKLPEKEASTWSDYRKCALDAIEGAIDILKPVVFEPADGFHCMNQRIQVIIEPAELSYHKISAKK